MNTEMFRKPLPLWVRGLLAVAFAMLCFVSAWVFNTVNLLEDRVASLEARFNSKENEVQWMTLCEHTEELSDLDKEVEVMSRLFGHLLDQNKLRVEGVSWRPSNDKITVELKSTEKFRLKQTQRYRQLQQEPAKK